jgi:hypothetical protein
VDGAAPILAVARAGMRERVAAVRPWVWLGAMVAAGAAVRFGLALAHTVPSYIPDEYVYAALGRSLGEHGTATIRGAHAPFPALLQPLLTAPLWRIGSVETGYALVKALNAVAMAASAVPVFLLARRLRLSGREAVFCGVLAVLSPNLYFVSFALSNPVSYPLALGAVVAGVAVLEEATARRQLLFLVLAGLAAFASIQLAVLPLALVAAALLVERGRVRRVASELRLTLGLLALAAVGVLAGSGALGIYRHAPGLSRRLGAADWAHELTRGTFLLAIAAGAAFAPGALAAIVHGLTRSRAREERAFAALVVTLFGGLLVESAPVAFESGRFEERYLLVISPLLSVAFLLWRRSGYPFRRVAAGGAIALLVALALLPLSTYAVRYGASDSPLLTSVSWLERELGSGAGALAAALLGSACALAALLAALRPARQTSTVALAAGLVWLVAVSGASSAFAIHNAQRVRAQQPHDLDWIDLTGARDGALVSTFGARPDRAVLTLFWNPHALTSELRLGHAEALDQYGAGALRVGADGRLLRHGPPVQAPLLFDDRGTIALLSGATRLRMDGYSLWRPTGTPRLRLLAEGFWSDGRLDAHADVELWPRRSGTLRLRLRAPAARAERLRLTAPGLARTLTLARGEARELELPVSASKPYLLRIEALSGVRFDGDRSTAGFAATPVFEPS